MLYSDLERQEQARIKAKEKHDNECISCPRCNSQWFEAVNAQRFQLNHNIIVGQDVPPQPSTIPYKLLRCVLCGNLVEPRILHNTRDLAAGDYEVFLDTMEGHLDKRPEDQRELKPEELGKLRQLCKDHEKTLELIHDLLKKAEKNAVPSKRQKPAPDAG